MHEDSLFGGRAQKMVLMIFVGENL